MLAWVLTGALSGLYGFTERGLLEVMSLDRKE